MLIQIQVLLQTYTNNIKKNIKKERNNPNYQKRKNQNCHKNMKGKVIVTGIPSVSFTHSAPLIKHRPVFILYQRWKQSTEPPLAIIHHKRSLFKLSLFHQWPNRDAMRHSWLGSLMRRKIQSKKEEEEEEFGGWGGVSASPPLGLPVHSGSLYMKLQSNVGASSSLNPTSSRSQRSVPHRGKHRPLSVI